MIAGIGTDIVEIARIEAALSRHQDRFLNRLLTDQERSYWSEHGSRVESLAGLWAAKEAVAKALGTGFRQFGLTDLEIIHDQLGGPQVILRGGADQRAQALGVCHVLVSIAHSQGHATAFALATGAGRAPASNRQQQKGSLTPET